ncbi:DUF6502 family protein [Variovorax sp. YR752]|uniref:DUF6502 family protein n=1 Tax=Variovorax sp. YR752 TaxID=1884383 RepID=UPI0031381ABD
MNEPLLHPDGNLPPGEQPALIDALRRLLVPLARLAVSRGVTHATVDEMLRAAFVDVAHAAYPQLLEHRRVSRISAATGINRREVTRLTDARQRRAEPARSYPSEAFARWSTHSEYLDAEGRPRVLPRLGVAPSFETLAQSVTRDMHPRSLLEELMRLGLAEHNADADTVSLRREAFVPRGDEARMVGFMGDNLGDHFSAAVDNVLAVGREHFEQAIYADGLSDRSLAELRELVTQHWRTMTSELVPRIEKMIAADDAAGIGSTLGPGNRMRIGLFSYQVAADEPDAPPAATTARKPARRTRRREGDAT